MRRGLTERRERRQRLDEMEGRHRRTETLERLDQDENGGDCADEALAHSEHLALWQGGKIHQSANQRRQWAGQGTEQGTAQALAGDF